MRVIWFCLLQIYLSITIHHSQVVDLTIESLLCTSATVPVPVYNFANSPTRLIVSSTMHDQLYLINHHYISLVYN
ncbi:hypothetical protein GLYMA_06G150550v4 [Glycine max]|nr:hypothetical protein GLYMA_06G150550v4 [Glycine max]